MFQNPSSQLYMEDIPTFKTPQSNSIWCDLQNPWSQFKIKTTKIHGWSKLNYQTSKIHGWSKFNKEPLLLKCNYQLVSC